MSDEQEPRPFDVRVFQAIVRSSNSVIAIVYPGRIPLDVAQMIKRQLDEHIGLDPKPGRIFVLGDGVTLQAALDAEVIDHGVLRLDHQPKSEGGI
jgi:hypothetical protein